MKLVNKGSKPFEKNSNNALSFIGVLQIVFIVLKLCDIINWHWLIVLIPLEAEVLIRILIVCVYFVFKLRERKQNDEIQPYIYAVRQTY